MDRTAEMKGKAIVWFPGRVYEIPDPEKDQAEGLPLVTGTES